MALTPDFTLTQNDTGPAITAQLEDALGVGVNVTGATVTFRMAAISDGTIKVNGSATLNTPAQGEVSYAWQAADTDAAGYYLARWKVVYPNGLTESFPNDRELLVLVKPTV